MNHWIDEIPDRTTPESIVAYWLEAKGPGLKEFFDERQLSVLRQIVDAELLACVSPTYYEREKP